MKISKIVSVSAVCAATMFVCAAGPVEFTELPPPVKTKTEKWFCGKLPNGKALRGETVAFEVTAEGPKGSVLELSVFNEGSKSAIGEKKIRLCGGARTVRFYQKLPKWVNKIEMRVDVEKTGRGAPVRLVRARAGEMNLFEPMKSPNTPPPEGPAVLLFHAPFEGTADSLFANGRSVPVRCEGIEFVPGAKGQAIKLTHDANSILEYSFKDNVVPERGTIAFWAKQIRPYQSGRTRNLFAFAMKDVYAGRWGTGAPWFSWESGKIRGALSDIDDHIQNVTTTLLDQWHHYALAWDESLGLRIWIDGIPCGYSYDWSAKSPTGPAVDMNLNMPFFFNRPVFETFFVGCGGTTGGKVGEQADGLIDEFKIFDRMLTDEEMSREFARIKRPQVELPDYAAIYPDVPNPYLKPLGKDSMPGVPTDMELVDEVVFDSIPADTNRFRMVGKSRIGELGGTKFLELDPRSRRGRMAYRFKLDPSVPIHIFEIDYPDDIKRTADVLVQPSKTWDDYTLNTGFMTGDEYPVSGKIQTMRYILWTQSDDVSLVVMTARKNAPAAIAAVRVYKVKDGKLPEAKINEPPLGDGEWPRTVGMYWEDPAIAYDFGLPRWDFAKPEKTGNLIDRTIALMKFTGMNFFAYPGSWYAGTLGVGFNTRLHAPDFLSAWYVKFDHAGLYFMPTLNVHTMPIKPGLVTWESARDGSLHDSPITIFSSGLTAGNGTHGTPPSFCFYHPDVQKQIRKEFNTLVDQGLKHKSFKGVALHLTLHPFLHWGDEIAGYNDYCIDGFTRDTGIKVPVDRKDPMRGKAYHDWLKANAWDRWRQWRCDKVTEFYAELASEMRAKRSDLKIWFNSLGPMNWWGLAFRHPKWTTPEWVEYQARWMGLDPEGIKSKIPNAIIGQCFSPADYRWRYGDQPPSRDSAYQRDLDLSPGLWWSIDKADYPIAHQHDRYFEDAVGRTATGSDKLSGDWFRETVWRVSVINPVERNALRSFAAPLKYGDVLGLTKGGFLIGTYGMENIIVPWIQAFRALPPVKMKDVPVRGKNVVVRRALWKGKTYFYVLNTSDRPVSATLAFPKGTEDLVSGCRIGTGEEMKFNLDAWELRSFAVPGDVALH